MMNHDNPIPMENESLAVYQPRYVDAAKTRIRAFVKFPNGKVTEIEAAKADRRSDLIRDVYAQYTEAEIEAFTARERSFEEQKEKIAAQAAEDARLAEEREVTFQAKAKALALPEVLNCPDKRVARKIRRSKSAFEVAGWLAVAFLKSLEAEEETGVEERAEA